MSPGTVASAYRTLRLRGVVNADGRRGTRVAAQPPLRIRPAQQLPPNVRDLASGNPDLALLPPLAPAFERLKPEHKLYGGPNKLARLVERAERDFRADGVDGEIAVLGGALDAFERLLQTNLTPGDRVVVEDPTWPRIADLLSALGFILEPAPVDRRGLVPGNLAACVRRGAKAVIATPRGQNPTGAAMDDERARSLRRELARRPDVLVIEDDYAGAIAGAPYVELHSSSRCWAVVRSLSKVLGPDLRVAPVAGDPLTISRVEGRQLLTAGWVSHILQQTAAQVWTEATRTKLLARSARTYSERRAALVAELAERRITAYGDSGLGVWVPVEEEVAVVQRLLGRGWAVSAGERYRFHSAPGIRITTTALEPHDARALAAAVAESLAPSDATYAG